MHLECLDCGFEAESADELERHRCYFGASNVGQGCDAPADWSDTRKRDFAWRPGELDGIQPGNWKSGKR